MKKMFLVGIVLIAAGSLKAQDIKASAVPKTVKTGLMSRFPTASKLSWEKEKGNYEANWGGKSGEDNSAMFTPAGVFIEIVNAIPVSALPASIAPYIAKYYKGAKIKEAGKVTNASGKTMFEAEIKGGDLIFDEKGNFIKKD
jgi:hypothetical protein